MFSWSSSPTLQRIYQGLEEQHRIIDQFKAYLEERLAPLQQHMNEHQRYTGQALKHVESRLKPLRQYVRGGTQDLNRVTAHLEADLKEHFEAFERFLASQRNLLEKANQHIEKQPRPLQTYLEDERKVVEMIYRDIERRLDRFFQNLSDQQQVLDFLHQPGVDSEYDALVRYLEERHKAFQRYVRSFEYRPAELFAQLEEAADHYKRQHQDDRRLSDKVLEETRLADEKLRSALPVPVTSPPEDPEKSPRLPRGTSTKALFPIQAKKGPRTASSTPAASAPHPLKAVLETDR